MHETCAWTGDEANGEVYNMVTETSAITCCSSTAGVSEERRRARAHLGDTLGALGDGVLGELAGQDEADGGLDLARGDGRLLVVRRELGRLGRDALEDVVDERVEDQHGLGESAEDEGGARRTLLEMPVSGWTCLRTL